METAEGLIRESGEWLAVLAAHGARTSRPLLWELAPDAERQHRQLPLRLEPLVNYQAGQVITARDPQGRVPSQPVRAHETAHYAFAPLGATTARCLGLEGLCDVAGALLTGDPVMAMPAVPGLTRDLRHPAFEATASLSTRAHLARVPHALGHGSGISSAVLDQVEGLLADAPDDDIQTHAFGVPFGHWLWTVLSPLSRDASLRALVHAAAVPQATPGEAVQAIVETLPEEMVLSAIGAAARLGLAPAHN